MVLLCARVSVSQGLHTLSYSLAHACCEGTSTPVIVWMLQMTPGLTILAEITWPSTTGASRDVR